MEIPGVQCAGCGSSEVEFIESSRKLICHKCGREDYWSRATLNKNRQVIINKDNAMKFFLEGDIDTSRCYALEVLNIFVDNIPAKYIISYFDEVKNGKIDSIKECIKCIQDTKDVHGDEIRDFSKLVIASARYLHEYSSDIIEVFVKNMQAMEDRKELSEIMDKICPYFIQLSSSIDFLKDKGLEYYTELAQNLDIPKTCFYLIKAIEENPYSPYVNNSFYMSTKTKYFYDEFVVPVGDIISKMKESEYKEKLKMAYQQKLLKYKQEAKY